MTWNPSSLKTFHSQPSPKLTHILQLARTHICHLQETQWTSLQYNHLHQQAPFCSIIHAPCIDHYSSGVATFIPHPLISTSHSIIVPGFILSVITSISGVQCELINIYLHPDKLVLLGQKLLAHLQSAPSRQYPLRIIGGDFNQLQSKSSTLFDSILNELNCSSPPNIPSFRRLDGYSSSLDFFLAQVPSHTSHHLTSKSFSFWPSYQPTGHGIHICRFRTNPHIASSPNDLPAQAIPFGFLSTSFPINSHFVCLSSSIFTTTHPVFALPFYSLPPSGKNYHLGVVENPDQTPYPSPN